MLAEKVPILPMHRDPIERFALVVGYVVTAMWALTLIVGSIDKDRAQPAPVSAIMMVVATGAFGVPLFRKKTE